MPSSRNNQTDRARDPDRIVLVRNGHRWNLSWGNGDEAALLGRVDALSRTPGSGLDRADAAVIRHRLEALHPNETMFGPH